MTRSVWKAPLRSSTRRYGRERMSSSHPVHTPVGHHFHQILCLSLRHLLPFIERRGAQTITLGSFSHHLIHQSRSTRSSFPPNPLLALMHFFTFHQTVRGSNNLPCFFFPWSHNTFDGDIEPIFQFTYHLSWHRRVNLSPLICSAGVCS